MYELVEHLQKCRLYHNNKHYYYKYKITAIEGTTRTIITYFDEANKAIKTERVETNIMEFITPENCTKIRVGFLNSNKQEAINGYIIEKL